MVSFLEYFVFFGAVFCTEQLEIIFRKDFDMFLSILIFDPKRRFRIGYSLCMMADFQNGLISRIFRCFLERFFAQNNSKSFVEMILTWFLWILIFWPKVKDFAWAIAFAWWPIFKMVSFFEYFVFFGSGFLRRTTPNHL